MSENLYRKKSMDRINSPEQLDDYICVSNPGVWLLLISILMLLLGACIWGVFGQMESTTPIRAQVKDGMVVAYVDSAQMDCIHTGMTVHFSNADGAVISVDTDTESGLASIYIDAPLEDGIHSGKIVLESIHPISFILN